MFVSSMVVFVHIALGGVVGLDIRRSICLRDLLFGALLSILITIYTITKFFFLSSVERKNLYDSHLIHALINLILLMMFVIRILLFMEKGRLLVRMLQ